MKIFLDSAHVDQIEEALTWGIIDGVTTNPSHVAATGANPRELYPTICRMVDGPVSLEAVSMTADEIVPEARELAKIGDNVVVKVPIMQEGLVAVKRLAAEGIKVNVTAVFSAVQALLAAKAGAAYVSPFIGHLDNAGHDGIQLVEQIRSIFVNYSYETEIIVAAARHPNHILRAALAGGDICTMSMDVLKQLPLHPLTDVMIDRFLKAWEQVPK